MSENEYQTIIVHKQFKRQRMILQNKNSLILLGVEETD